MLCHQFQWAQDQLGKSSSLDLLEGHFVLLYTPMDTVSAYDCSITDHQAHVRPQVFKEWHTEQKKLSQPLRSYSLMEVVLCFLLFFSNFNEECYLTSQATTESLDWKLQHYVSGLLPEKGNLFHIYWRLLQNTLVFLNDVLPIISMPLLINFTAFSRGVFSKTKTSGQHSIRLLFL